MSISATARIRKRDIWIFFALTYILTWIFWIPLALSGQDVMAGPLMIALVLGGFGPSIAGIIMTYRTQDREGRRDFWRRSIKFRQIGGRWYAVILLIFPLVYGLAILLDMLLGGSAPGADAVAQIAAQPATLIGMLLTGLIIGPLPKEFGWLWICPGSTASSLERIGLSSYHRCVLVGLAFPALLHERHAAK